MPEKVKIIVDQRELRSSVAKSLESLGADLQFETCDVADYILSERVAAERKTGEDFLKSFLEDRKLFSQLHDLAACYEKPILIIEGEIDSIFTLRRVHPHSILSLLSTIAVSYRLPILYSLSAAETALILWQIAEKEQRENKNPFYPHGKRNHLTPDQQLEYTLSSIPEVGVIRARFLLRKFGSIQNIANAGAEELLQTPLVGDATAPLIREFFRRVYQKTSDEVRG